MDNLSWLIAPFDKEAFFKEIWQKKPLALATGRDGYFEKLFSGAALECALEFGQPKPPSIRLASSASNEEVVVPFCPNGRLDIDKLRKLYLQGNTIILDSIEDLDPAVAQLARSIETEMGARVQVNSYLTPPAAQGFRPHYDTHDVLIAQIQGKKLWKLFDSDSACPLHEMSDGDTEQRNSKQPPDQICLKAGDVLYIPRGWKHEAETIETASLHLTLGIHPPQGKDLLFSALEALCRRHPELHESLPVGTLCSVENTDEVADRFASLIRLFAEHASVDEAANAIDDRLLRRGRSGGDGHLFSDVDMLRGVSVKSIIERRTNMPCRLVKHEHGVGLQFLNGLIIGPHHFEAAMRYVMVQAEPFAVSSLPNLEPDHQVALATSLITDGLYRIGSNNM